MQGGPCLRLRCGRSGKELGARASVIRCGSHFDAPRRLRDLHWLAATLQRANIMVSELTIAVMLQLSQVAPPGLNPETATILAAEMGWVTVKQCSRPVPHPVEGVWRPDKETIVRLEKALAPALVDALRRAPIPEFRRYPPSDYYRQYVGLVVDGKRVVYVNGFHRKFLEISTRSGRTPDWRTTPINVCDGAELFMRRRVRGRSRTCRERVIQAQEPARASS